MYRLCIIEESLDNQEILNIVRPFFFSQRIEEIPEYEIPIWHINEFHVPDSELLRLLSLLEKHINPTWYIHVFNEVNLYVVLQCKSFIISREKDACLVVFKT